jgi:MFS family permease
MLTPKPARPRRSPWLNRTVLGIGLSSLFSDWSHETATAVLPQFLATLGAAAVWLGLIEGVSDGLSSFAKMASGYYTDRLRERKNIAVAGYLTTPLTIASIGLATGPWHVLFSRAIAWFGRGIRTPVRKALLAASVDSSAYGRAFGFERTMDTLGAIAGPASAFVLMTLCHFGYRGLFAATLVPGFIAVALIVFAVKETGRPPIEHVSFVGSLRALPANFFEFVVAVGVFGLGDFAHTLLILLATQKLTPTLGPATAAAWAIALYVLHNIFYASFGFVGGWLADHFNKRHLLATSYLLAALMALIIVLLPPTIGMFIAVFSLGGIFIALEETLEDSICAELANEFQHGTAFGTVATVNGIGDFASSLIVGTLWTFLGTTIAFSYTAVLSVVCALLVLSLPSEAMRSQKHI